MRRRSSRFTAFNFARMRSRRDLRLIWNSPRLDRPNAGQLLKAVEVGVEEDAAVADERHRRSVGEAALLGPSLRAVADVAGAEADVGSRVPFPRARQKGDGDQDARAHLRPRPRRDVARRDRLRLTRAVRGGLAESRRKRAFARSADLDLAGVRRRNR